LSRDKKGLDKMAHDNKFGLDKKELATLFLDELEKMDLDFSVVDFDLGCREYGVVDILSVTDEGQLVLIDLLTDGGDVSLVKFLNKLKFVMDLRVNLKDLYPRYDIDPDVVPSMMIIAPEFPPSFCRSLSFIGNVKIELFLYKTEEKHGKKKLRLLNLPQEKRRKTVSDIDELKRRLKKEMKHIDSSEIDSFFSHYDK